MGKSTLFNRLVGSRVAITDSIPGVTRDRLFHKVEWNGRTFELVDTAGIIIEVMEKFDGEVMAQVEAAIAQADLLMFVVDSRDGATGGDQELVESLRRTGKPVVLAVNKVDYREKFDVSEFHIWGFEHLIPVSGMRGTGSGDLLDRIVELLDFSECELDEDDECSSIAIIGKPNVGKSSLTNRLIGSDRMVVSDVAGTTRDPVDTMVTYKDRPLLLIDTAGLRKSMKFEKGVEYFTLLRTVRSIENCDLAIMMIDSREGATRQDLRIAELASESGKSMILVMNKWDIFGEKETNTAARIEKDFKLDYPHLSHVPMIFLSALTGQRVERLMDLALSVLDNREIRIATSRLNEVLRSAVSRNHPPAGPAGKFIQLYYCTQVAVAPPVIVIFTNDPENIPEQYRRYLIKAFRESFPFPGTPIRIIFRPRNAAGKKGRDKKFEEESEPYFEEISIDEIED